MLLALSSALYFGIGTAPSYACPSDTERTAVECDDQAGSMPDPGSTVPLRVATDHMSGVDPEVSPRQLFGNNVDGATHTPHRVDYSFTGKPGDAVVTMQIFDADVAAGDEIAVLVNGVTVLETLPVAEDTWQFVSIVVAHQLISDNSENTLTVRNNYNPQNSYTWAVNDVEITFLSSNEENGSVDGEKLPNSKVFGNNVPGATDSSHEVHYDFTGEAGDAVVMMELFDADVTVGDEIVVLVNGTSVSNAFPIVEDAWQLVSLVAADDLILDDEWNVLTVRSNYNPPNSYTWGVRNVSVAFGEGSLPQLTEDGDVIPIPSDAQELILCGCQPHESTKLAVNGYPKCGLNAHIAGALVIPCKE